MNDLTPKKLITYGQRVKLSIQTKTVTLKTIGIAKKSGHYGEFIEIENPKSKKRFLAKVIDFNKAIVEL
jgi:flagella basal body P-ring formation protein FlgA